MGSQIYFPSVWPKWLRLVKFGLKWEVTSMSGNDNAKTIWLPKYPNIQKYHTESPWYQEVQSCSPVRRLTTSTHLRHDTCAHYDRLHISWQRLIQSETYPRKLFSRSLLGIQKSHQLWLGRGIVLMIIYIRWNNNENDNMRLIEIHDKMTIWLC